MKIPKAVIAEIDNTIYDTAEFLGVVDGIQVFSPSRNSDKIEPTGLPELILYKNGKAEWIIGEESFYYMRKIYHTEEYNEEDPEVKDFLSMLSDE